ncbi:hypothetical protein [Stutzerimonas kunmingensis]|uniref:hypothetical protein n=1 Tax=Stutzerimonas kunmingensis TaxID=1211807 RepID=UPI0028A00D41|nr:hypothetical protein [Stutzerimonas kunmingensis]
MHLLRNRAEWAAWVERLAGISLRQAYNAPTEPAFYPCFGYAVLAIADAGYETEEPRYLYAADVAAMAITLLEPAA